MATESLPTLRWGVVGCGLISSWFVSDLCLERAEPTTRHAIQAIGSSSTAKGNAFVQKHCPSASPTVYDSYQGVYNDPDVDIVYIGTPHPFHCENALDAIAAGKHVLCEKPMAMNRRDAEKMMSAARAEGVFLMEAVWTRFFPLARKLQSLLHEDRAIGDVATVFVDFGLNMPTRDSAPGARTASRALGAGALLDVGIYSLTWAHLALDGAPGRQPGASPAITASMNFYSETDPEKKFDEQAAVLLKYPDIQATAVCTASMLYKTPTEFLHVYGSKGSIAVGGRASSRPRYIVVRADGEEERQLEFDVPGWGFHLEQDSIAADLRAGKTESSICPLDTTLEVMKWMDTARAQCGLVYPQDE